MVGAELRQLRKSLRGWPDTRLAKEIGVHVNHLRMVERSEYSCSEGMIIRAMSALGREDLTAFMLRLRMWNVKVLRGLPAGAEELKPMLEALGRLYAEERISAGLIQQLFDVATQGQHKELAKELVISTSELQAGSRIRITVEP